MSKKLVGMIVAALDLAVAACTTAPAIPTANDLQTPLSDQHYCKTHVDTAQCRQNNNNYWISAPAWE